MTSPREYLLAQTVDMQECDAWAWRCCDALGVLFVRDTGLAPPSQHGCSEEWAAAWHHWHRQMRADAREWLGGDGAMKTFTIGDYCDGCPCPFMQSDDVGEEENTWCNARGGHLGHLQRRTPDRLKELFPRPDWCPLRASGVVVVEATAEEREAEG